MESATSHSLSSQVSVSIRDRYRQNKRRTLLSTIASSSQFQTKQLKEIHQAAKSSKPDDLLPHLTTLKFISSQPTQISDFLYLYPALLKLAVETASPPTFKQLLHVLTNMSMLSSFSLPHQLYQLLPPIVKYGFTLQKHKPVLEFLSNLILYSNPNLMNTLIPAGLLQLVSTRFNLVFDNQDDEISFVIMLCGLLINSKSLEKPLKVEIIQMLSTIEVTNTDEMNWHVIVSLSDCGYDLCMAELIIKSKIFDLISKVLEGKFSKYILHIVKFFANISTEPQGCKLLESHDLYPKLLTVWPNRHPQIKPIITNIVMLFIKNQVFTVIDHQLFQQVFAFFKLFELQKEVLQFELGKLALALLKAHQGDKWVLPLVNFGVLNGVKVMLKSPVQEMACLGIQVLANVLEWDKSHIQKCRVMEIDRELEQLGVSQYQLVIKWAEEVVETFFKES